GTPPAFSICIIIEVPERGKPETTTISSVSRWVSENTTSNSPHLKALFFWAASGPIPAGTTHFLVDLLSIAMIKRYFRLF
ncbi:MAG: hypothetical protein ACPG5T_09650, partial [Endozoicomonas sp.]